MTTTAKGIPGRLRARPRLRRSPAPATQPALPSSERLLASLVGLTVALPFLPALAGNFVLWDDDRMFLDNYHYRGLGLGQLGWMLTTFYLGHWMPLTWLSLAFDYVLWGMNPAGYHATNLVLHGATGAVAYVLSLRLLRLSLGEGSSTRDVALRAGAAAAALTWGLHPLRVESVAWATERRDVLCGLFFLLAIVAYLRAVDRRRDADGSAEPALDRRWYAASLGFFALSLLSKAMAMSLPLILLILDVYPLRRWGGRAGWSSAGARRVLIEKVPFAILSLAAGVIAWAALGASGNASTVTGVTVTERIAIAVYAAGFYLWKIVVPVGLSPLYERHGRSDLFSWPVAASAIVLAAIALLAVIRRHRWPALPAVAAAYLVILLPVLGLVPHGHQIAADRYTYLAGLGWSILAGAGLARVLWRPPAFWPVVRLRAAAAVMGAVIVLILAALTWDQTNVWRDSETLWIHALGIDQRSAVALNNLGMARLARGQADEALALFQHAAGIRPTFALARFNWGHVLAARGDHEGAIERFREVLAIDPRFPAAHNDWGLALIRLGRPAEAIPHFGEALRLRPDYPTAESNWGLALLAQGRRAEAVERFRRAIALNPDHPEAHYNLGYALQNEGKLDDAIAQFREVVRVRPDHAVAHNDWGLALIQQGRPADAVFHLSEALRLQPDFAMAKNNLGLAFLRLDRVDEAIIQFREALTLVPDLALAHANWGLALAQQGHTADAVARFTRAVELDPTLAADVEAARRKLIGR